MRTERRSKATSHDVDMALKLATRMISLPSMVMLSPFLVLSFIVLRSGGEEANGGQEAIGALVVLCLGFVVSWLVWSIQTPKWRLRAYRMVNDIDLLKSSAVSRGILWPEGHFFERTEISSQELKNEILRIENEKSKLAPNSSNNDAP